MNQQLPENQAISKYMDAILEQAPIGVLVTDSVTRIRYANPAFRDMFRCGAANLLGERAAKFLHADCFERAIINQSRVMLKENLPEHHLNYHAGLFPLGQDDLYCGIFIDISEEEDAQKQYRELRAQTLERAQEVIVRQMKTAQEIARLLGETTAETKILLVKLMSLFEEEHK